MNKIAFRVQSNFEYELSELNYRSFETKLFCRHELNFARKTNLELTSL
jgi:hypothetical protein